jgi:cyclase
MREPFDARSAEKANRRKGETMTTRRDFLRWAALSTSAAALGAETLLGKGTLLQQSPTTAPPAMAFTELRGRVGIFTGQGGTIGWLVSPKAVAVVDTQFPATAKVCMEGLSSRSSGRQVDLVLNTHHHRDHTSGNGVFRGVAKKMVAHARVPELLKAAPAQAGSAPADPPTPPDTTFDKAFQSDLGDEKVSAQHYGPGHTGGDIVVFFESANVVHMGDLMFNRRHPFIDRPAGASVTGWISTLERVMKDHDAETIFIFGHAGEKWPLTGSRQDLEVQRDYFTALLDFVRGQRKAGTPREAAIKATDELKGFADHGPLTERVLTPVWDEVGATSG